MDNTQPREKAIEIMNKALQKLYSVKGLTSNQIISILEEFANNEKWQVEQDTIFHGNKPQ